MVFDRDGVFDEVLKRPHVSSQSLVQLSGRVLDSLIEHLGAILDSDDGSELVPRVGRELQGVELTQVPVFDVEVQQLAFGACADRSTIWKATSANALSRGEEHCAFAFHAELAADMCAA